MSVDSDYEIKFPLYDGIERDYDQYLVKYDTIKSLKKGEGNVMGRVISYFFEGYIFLIKGDKAYWNAKMKDAYQFYQEAIKMFTRFHNSRNVNVKLDQLSDRLTARSKGMSGLVESLTINDRELKANLLVEALNEFNSEVSLANEMEEQMSSYAAYARASLAECQLLKIQSEMIAKTDSNQAKKNVMKARDSIRQAAFIDIRLKSKVEEIEIVLDDLTKNRLLDKAINFGEKGSKDSEDGEFKKAIESYNMSSVFYKRASTLAADVGTRRSLLSTATVNEASAKEAEANYLYRHENDTGSASEKFEEAAKLVDKAIALMGNFGNELMRNLFSNQRDFYRGMASQTTGIHNFDLEDYDNAKKEFDEALITFKKVINKTKNINDQVFETLCTEAISEVQGYIAMCDAMLN